MPKTLKRTPKSSLPSTSSNSKSSPSSSPTNDSLKLFMLIHGKSGVGKTSFCANAPSPVFLIDHDETGVVRLKQRGLIPKSTVILDPVEDYGDLLDTLESFSPEDHGAETLVVDSLTGLQRLCFDYRCNLPREQGGFEGDYGAFYDFYRGPAQAAQQDWPPLMTALRRIRDKGVNVLLISHSEEKAYRNPDGPDYDKYVSALDARIWKATERVVEAVLFLNFEIDVQGSRRGQKGKASDITRMIITDKTPTADAKNWYGLPAIIDMGESGQDSWNNFWEAFTKETSTK